MSIARASIDKSLLTWILILGCLFGGIWGFYSVGRLEDPAFTIKQAVIATHYAGASAEQVAQEVSEPLESAIQKLGEVDKIISINTPGMSLIKIEVKSSIDGSQLPAFWTKLRQRVGDAARRLPQGVSTPFVNDAFGDVFGIFYAVTAEGFSDAERHQLATFLRRELLAVKGVANVDVAGLPEETIFIDTSLALTANQNIPPAAVVNAIATANTVSDAGHVDGENNRIAIYAPDGSDTVGAIAGLSVGVQGKVLNLFDFADVTRGRVEQPSQMIRYNGVEAFTIGIAGLSTENIIEVGHRVDAQLETLKSEIPLGVELQPIYQQHLLVEAASSSFIINLAMSVAIVVVVLAIFMGWRAAIVVGATLLLTVVGTLFFMAIFSIEMERISLGALIIAMGMLVDNAIVVAEGMQMKMAGGTSSRDAAEDVASKTQIPLLGATVIGVMAFAGIGLSPDSTGEFLFSLFAVIGISLMLSWVLSITITPLLAHYFFVQGSGIAGDHVAYDGPIFGLYRKVLRGALKSRWLVIASLVGVTLVCFVGFGQVKQQFFPNSNTPIFYVHYKLPQGTPIHQTASDMALMEAWLAEREEVKAVSTFVGQGATRFMLTYSPEDPNPSYGHLLVEAVSLDAIPQLRADFDAFGAKTFPQAEFRTERIVFGPGDGAPIAVRFSGPDPKVLRELAETAKLKMAAASQNVHHLRIDWRDQELILRPIYATERAQTAGVTRDDIANTLRYATDGMIAGVFREGERQIPITVRQNQDEKGTLLDQIVYATSSNAHIPLEQVIDGIDYEVQNTLFKRRDRLPTITLSADIPPEQTAAGVQAELVAAMEEIPLPLGYELAWGGEYENSKEAKTSLANQLPISFLVMVLISIFLFGTLRQPLVIWLLVPMSVNGVALALLGTGLPFSFTALLGLLSLSGMLIKNGIVLVEEIDLVRAEGVPFTQAIVEACTSRIRPVFLAAVTTILGMVPLLGDAFFASMAVTIMGGLAFATVLTLIAAPVFYYVSFPSEIKKERAAA